MKQTSLTRPLFFVLGCLCVGLGILGIYLPVLPTTPFMLLASMCFAKSSPRLHAWLINHKSFGRMIVAWQTRRAIPRHAKWLSWTMMTISCAMLFWRLPSQWWWLGGMVSMICLATVIWMARLPDA